MTKHNTMSPQRDPDPRATVPEIAKRVSAEYSSTEEISSRAVLDVYEQIKGLARFDRERVLSELRPRAREQVRAFMLETFRAKYGERPPRGNYRGGRPATPSAPPVGSVGPVTLSGRALRPRPGETSTHREGSAVKMPVEPMDGPLGELSRAAVKEREHQLTRDAYHQLGRLWGALPERDRRKIKRISPALATDLAFVAHLLTITPQRRAGDK